MQNIRNFAIVAHIDHGKSTLADRLLEITGTISPRHMQSQVLDSNPIERERGITIKLAPVRMMYHHPSGQKYTLNLIDTPGHVDFSYEVSRSLAACEGVILLVDATQGVQAQTLAHFHKARQLGLTIIPAINKIDVSTADIPTSLNQIESILGFNRQEVVHISGKTGQGVPDLLTQIVSRIPPPQGDSQAPLRALVFNSNFDPHLGVVAWVRLVDGQITAQDKLLLMGTHAPTHAVEVGVFTPAKIASPILSAGEVGYVVTNLKDISLLTVGDTLTMSESFATTKPSPLPGYQPIKPVVFISFYPTDGDEIHLLRSALEKLKLEDSALQFTPEFSPALGNGFRVGFLGLLHADVVQERLEREFDINLIAAAPSVGYQVLTKANQLIEISKAVDLPDPSEISQIMEPTISLSIIAPEQFTGSIMQLCQSHRGTLIDMVYQSTLVNLQYQLPLSELIKQFYDELKSLSQGFATLDYELSGYQPAPLVKLDILVAGEKVDALSQIIPSQQAPFIAKSLVEQLKEIIPRQQFEIAISHAFLARRQFEAPINTPECQITGHGTDDGTFQIDKLPTKIKDQPKP
jgi:GTP-binding protein LepA